MDYVVKAGYVTVETNVGPGRARVDIPRGAPLPGDVPQEDVDRLLRADAIEANEQEPDELGDSVPDGTIAEVLAWVDSDRDRAAQALAAEQAKGDKARSTLVADLEKVVTGDE